MEDEVTAPYSWFSSQTITTWVMGDPEVGGVAVGLGVAEGDDVGRGVGVGVAVGLGLGVGVVVGLTVGDAVGVGDAVAAVTCTTTLASIAGAPFCGLFPCPGLADAAASTWSPTVAVDGTITSV